MNQQQKTGIARHGITVWTLGLIVSLGALSACGGGEDGMAPDPGVMALAAVPSPAASQVLFPECPSGTHRLTSAPLDTSRAPAAGPDATCR